MNLQLESPVSPSTATDAGELVRSTASPIELRTDHSIGRALLLRSAADLLAERASFSWCCAITPEPTLWDGTEHALALCVRADTARTPIGVSLGRLPLGLYASPGYLRAFGAVTLPQWFAGRRVIDLELGQPQRLWTLRSGLARIDTRVPAETTVTGNLHEAVRFAVSGLGLAWLPALVVGDELRRGLLQPALSGQWRRFTPPLHLCLPHRRKPRPDALSIADRLSRLLASDERL